MDEQREVVNGFLKLTNYNFLDIKSILLIIKNVSRCTFTEVRGNDLQRPFYLDANGDLDREKCGNFHRNMIEVLNAVKGLSEVVIENYPFLEDNYFQYLHIPRWESLTSFKLIKCPKLTKVFFRWVSNNCRKLSDFELTCRFMPINPIYQSSNEFEDKDFFYKLMLEDLIRFFELNSATLKSCQFQLTHFGNYFWEESNKKTVCGFIMKCASLTSFNLWLKTNEFDLAQIILLLSLPDLVNFKLSVGLSCKTIVELVSGNDAYMVKGFVTINNLDKYLIDACFVNHLLDVFHSIGSPKRTFSNLILSGLVGISGELVRRIAVAPILDGLTSVRFDKCGTLFDSEDIKYLVDFCHSLKFLAVIEGDETIGPTNIQMLKGRVVFAVMKSESKWGIDEVRHYKTHLHGGEDFDWLVEKSEGKLCLENDDDEDV